MLPDLQGIITAADGAAVTMDEITEDETTEKTPVDQDLLERKINFLITSKKIPRNGEYVLGYFFGLKDDFS